MALTADVYLGSVEVPGENPVIRSTSVTLNPDLSGVFTAPIPSLVKEGDVCRLVFDGGRLLEVVADGPFGSAEHGLFIKFTRKTAQASGGR
jgi:hypothetical protein